MGITGGTFFEPGTEPQSFIVAIKAAVERTWFIIKMSLTGLKQMIVGSISACNLSGPVAIAETAGQMASQGALPFLALIAGLSTAVGLMNLFPIPILDGGHLVFCAYEATHWPQTERFCVAVSDDIWAHNCIILDCFCGCHEPDLPMIKIKAKLGPLNCGWF